MVENKSYEALLEKTSGKKVKLYHLSRREAQGFKVAGIGTYEARHIFYDVALAATRLSESEFEEKYTDEEIIEIAGIVLAKTNLIEEQKKS